MDTCQNDPKNSYTEKKIISINLTGYAMLTHCSFDVTKK